MRRHDIPLKRQPNRSGTRSRPSYTISPGFHPDFTGSYRRAIGYKVGYRQTVKFKDEWRCEEERKVSKVVSEEHIRVHRVVASSQEGWWFTRRNLH